MKAIQLTATGNPLETLKYVELPDPKAPKNGEVIIRMEYSPINFSDLMVAKGIYFIQPELPAVIGGEGVGVISEVGRDVTHLKVGDRVVLPFGTYAWSELVKAPAENLVALAPSADAKQASMIGINPPTAVLLLDEFTTLQENDWIVFNAGNSSVAHTFVTVAKSRKLKTLAIVRREDAVAVAKAAGADVVLVENSNIAEQANSATNGANIRLGLDAVGGESSGVLAKILGGDSHLVAYAVLSGQPMVVSQVDLITKRMKVHGFWMYLEQYLPKLNAAVRESERLLESGSLNVPIAATYPLSAINEAVAHATKGVKVLLDFNI
jgi:NADPH:quinone reductase-like Zn-dependent oxidoreductase